MFIVNLQDLKTIKLKYYEKNIKTMVPLVSKYGKYLGDVHNRYGIYIKDAYVNKINIL